MSSGQRTALQSKGVGEIFHPPANLIRIAEEDPTHPHHAEHMARVSLADPDMQALLASLREFGWRKAITMPVYLDGDAYAASDGRRRLTCVRIVNDERKASKDKRGPIFPRCVIDDQPALTTTMANAMHKDDPPMVKARRFVENTESMGAQAAARAAGFLTLADANACAAILKIPDASLHAAVNSGAVTVDTAARAARGGSSTVRKVLGESKGEGGKIDGGKARDAARAAVPKRPKARSPKTLATTADELEKIGFTDAAELIRWMQGGPPPVAYVKAIESAEGMRRKPRAGNGARMTKASGKGAGK